jgi:hypothetical protein
MRICSMHAQCLTNIKHFRVDIQLYQHEWKLGKRGIVFEFSQFPRVLSNCISIRKKCFIFVL